MKKCLIKSLLILSIIFPIIADENFAANPVPADCISLTGYYPRAHDDVTYYTFSNSLETYNGYKAYFRVFIPPGAVIEDMLILDYGKQMAVVRHKKPPTGLPQYPPQGYQPDFEYSLDELESEDKWVTETQEGLLNISRDMFYPCLDISRAGWLYVKVGGGDYSSVYSNQFAVRVDTKAYNEWWDTYIKDESGWNKYVQNVGIYIDPTQSTAILTVNPASQTIGINAGNTIFQVSNTGSGSMPWKAVVTQGSDWLTIVSGSTGTDADTITCSYTAASSTRTGNITITADGATGSPVDVKVVQEGKSATSMPVPATGQITCYDADGNQISPCPVVGQPYFGQDANYQINPMSYTKLDRNGHDLADNAVSWMMVRDNVTGLIWDVDASKRGDRTTTSKVIESLNTNKYGGYGDWRLPTVKELYGLVTYRIPYINPVINEVYFPNTKSSVYWTVTPNAMDTTYAWGVDFNIGTAAVYANASNCYVRAVRGESSEVINYSDNGIGTVTDKNTGLMWQQDGSSSGNLTWESALNYCETLVLGGYADWRMPTIKELMSLADYTQTNVPAINKDFFDPTKSVFYWASTTTNHEDYASHAWGVDYKDATPLFYTKETSNPVRAVRSVSMLSVTPSSQEAAKDEGSVTFNVFISSAKTFSWKAEIVGTTNWLTLDAKGTNSNTGIITCNYTANTVAESRTAIIRITATGAELNSPVDVTVIQEPSCAATKINQQLHIPYLTYNVTTSQKMSLSADFVQTVNPLYPGLELYKLSTVAKLTNPPLTCTPSTLSDKFVIHIPDLIINGTHFWMELTYNPFLSTSTDAIFVATAGGIITN